MIIALVNSKGGVGKSTIAGNLSAWLFDEGHSVILADCDPQQSCSEWLSEAKPGIDVVSFTNSDEVFEELPVLAGQADYIIAEVPARRRNPHPARFGRINAGTLAHSQRIHSLSNPLRRSHQIRCVHEASNARLLA